MRMKPESGFLEMDVNMNTGFNFDKSKGLKWGDAISAAKRDGPNAFGMAGGLQPAFKNFRAGGNAHNDDEDGGLDQVYTRMRNFDAAVNNGHVMNKQTLGGQIIRHQPGMPIYMLGAFRGSKSV